MNIKQLGCLIIYVVFSSCTKTKDGVHFHGRITLDCNNSQPASNVTVFIKRFFDRGVQDANDVGTTVTDNDGYYSLIADVKQEGNFEHYELSGGSAKTSSLPAFNFVAQSYDNSDNVEINCEAQTTKTGSFHIKNTTPYSSSDILNSLIIYWNNGINSDTIVKSLVGTNVDTTVFSIYESQITYRYSFTKNNVLTQVPDTTILDPNCLDSLSINVFY